MTKANKVTHAYYLQIIVNNIVLGFVDKKIQLEIQKLGEKHKELTGGVSTMFTYEGNTYNLFDTPSGKRLHANLKGQAKELIQQKTELIQNQAKLNNYVSACFNKAKTSNEAVSLFFDSLRNAVTNDTRYYSVVPVDEGLRTSINKEYKDTVEMAQYFLTLKLLQ